ncbi:MAG TPA: hypothetical protein VMI10_00350 [Terriglobales bacterium]|nr:hypothetical protein [Terriglobales bacterium]HVN17790.1 hypothetical protein [Dongiaceae bacterium]HXJ87575.1 hypothetical protein [Candidatus Binatia bacterium]
MDDKQVVAAILTLALRTAERESAQKTGPEHWRTIWKDYNRFLKEIERADDSIDKRGIHPD